MATTLSRRLEKIKSLPWYYSAILHIILPSILFISGIGYLYGLYTFYLTHALLIPIILIALNLMEYIIHKFTFHNVFPGLKSLYDKHTKNHHVLFTSEDMKITNIKEVAYILIPLPTLFIFLILLSSFGFLLNFLLGLNLTLLFLILSLVYVLLYEWTHLFFHWSDKFFGSKLLHKYLSRFHKIHHNTRYMNSWNFNVTLPIWDKIFKTLKKEVL